MGNEASSGPHTADEPPRQKRLATQAQAIRYIGATVRLPLEANGKKRTAPEAGAPEAQRRRLILTPEGIIVTADVVTVNEGEISPTLWAELEEKGGWPRTGTDRIILVAHKLDYDDEGDRLRDLNFLFDHFRPTNQTISRVFSQIMSRISESVVDFLYAKVSPSLIIFQRLLYFWQMDDEKMLRLLADDRFRRFRHTGVREYLLEGSHFLVPVTPETTRSGAIWSPSETVSREMRRYVRREDFSRLLSNFRVYLARDVRNDRPIDFIEDYTKMWSARLLRRGVVDPSTFQFVYPRRRHRAFVDDYALNVVFGGWENIKFTDEIDAQMADEELMEHWVSSAPPMLVNTFIRILGMKKIKLDANTVWKVMALNHISQPYMLSVAILLHIVGVTGIADAFTMNEAYNMYTKEDVFRDSHATPRTLILANLVAEWRRPVPELISIVKQNLEFGLIPSYLLLSAWIRSYKRSWQQRPGEWSPDPDALRILQLFFVLGARPSDRTVEKLPDEESKRFFLAEVHAAQEALLNTLLEPFNVAAEDIERWRIAGAAAGSDDNVWLAVSELSLDE